jgi:predicted membrane protein
MRSKWVRVILFMIGAQVVATIVGQVIARRLTRGDEDTDEFQIAAFCGGKKFHSFAKKLRKGTVITSMGGIDLDLRDATLDPEGAELELKATMGGVQVTVPEDWAVDVDAENHAGGFDIRVTPEDQLPADAPRLHIHAVTRMGGGVVTAKAA